MLPSLLSCAYRCPVVDTSSCSALLQHVQKRGAVLLAGEGEWQLFPWAVFSLLFLKAGKLCKWQWPNSQIEFSCWGRVELVCQDYGQSDFEYIQGWSLPNLPGQPLPVRNHPHSKWVKKAPGIIRSFFLLLGNQKATPRHHQGFWERLLWKRWAELKSLNDYKEPSI